MSEIIYVFTNEAMPGLIKIGRTTTNIEQRMRELDTTGVPYSFQCFYAAIVPDGPKVEKSIHYIFGEHRCRTNREFFRADANRVKATIELVAIEDITPKIEDNISEEDQTLANSSRRQVFRFSLAKVPVGAEIEFIRDPSKKCRVLDDRNIEFEGQTTTLTGAASQILHSMGWQSGNVSGPLYWAFEGESLDERRRRCEENPE